MACAGCSTSAPVETPEARQLPDVPAFVKPVHVQQPRADDDTELVAARERAGRAKANDIIVCFVDWQARMKAAYASGEKQKPSAFRTCLRLEAER